MLKFLPIRKFSNKEKNRSSKLSLYSFLVLPFQFSKPSRRITALVTIQNSRLIEIRLLPTSNQSYVSPTNVLIHLVLPYRKISNSLNHHVEQQLWYKIHVWSKFVHFPRVINPASLQPTFELRFLSGEQQSVSLSWFDRAAISNSPICVCMTGVTLRLITRLVNPGFAFDDTCRRELARKRGKERKWMRSSDDPN